MENEYGYSYVLAISPIFEIVYLKAENYSKH